MIDTHVQTFQTLIAAFADEVSPVFSPLNTTITCGQSYPWPYFWVTMAALNYEDKWRFCYFSIVGRFEKTIPIKPVQDTNSSKIVFKSEFIDAEKMLSYLRNIQNNAEIEILNGIKAEFPTEQASALVNRSALTKSIYIHNFTEPVIEHVPWRYAHGTWYTRWKDDHGVAQSYLNQALKPDFERIAVRDCKSYLEAYTQSNTTNHNQWDVNDFRFDFDLPLPIEMKEEIPQLPRMCTSFTLLCPNHFNLKVKAGKTLANAEVLTLATDSPPNNKISVRFDIPIAYQTFWIESENGFGPLHFQFNIPSLEEDMLNVIGCIHKYNNVEKGKKKWQDDLISSNSFTFEVALANALSRFGIPVLFSGQLQSPTLGSGATEHVQRASGTATPGYDLVAIDFARKQLLLISAKGSPKAPSENECNSLLSGIKIVSSAMPQWRVYGVIICHAERHLLGRYENRQDLRVLGLEDIHNLISANSKSQAEFLLGLTQTPFVAWTDQYRFEP